MKSDKYATTLCATTDSNNVNCYANKMYTLEQIGDLAQSETDFSFCVDAAKMTRPF